MPPLALLATLVLCAGDLRVPYGSAEPPVQWEAAGEPVGSGEASSYLRAAARLLGISFGEGNRLGVTPTATALRGEWQDHSGFGEHLPRAWMVTVRDVLVTDAGDSAAFVPVTVSLVFEDGGRFVCALVTNEGPWALPQDGTYEELASVARDPLGWEVGPAADTGLASTIPEVLGGVWAVFAVNPLRARFIAIRPRFVSLRYPADDGAGSPVRDHHQHRARWIVEVRGTVVQTRHGYPYTGLLAVVTDGEPRRLQGTTLR